jgi:hypothetical protein
MTELRPSKRKNNRSCWCQQSWRGAAARFSLSLIAAAMSLPGIGATAMRG